MAISCRSFCVHALVCLFGIGSWVDINGVWVELPIMVQHLPEGWNLGSYLVIIIQLANIAPLIVTLMAHFKPSKFNEKPIVYLILFIGAAACLLLAFLWNTVTVVAGVKHSVALLVLQFFLAMVDCTSSVVFLPFMSVFKKEYMATYFVGEGLSGLLPSVVAFIQGAGSVRCVHPSHSFPANASILAGNSLNHTVQTVYPEFLPPLFPVRAFFIFLFFMMVVCCSAFIILNHHPFCRSEKVSQVTCNNRQNFNEKHKKLELFSSNNGCVVVNGQGDDICTTSLLEDVTVVETNQGTTDPLSCPLPDIKLSKCVYFYYLLLTAWMNALTNGVLPSIQSFSCLPYGLRPYHLAVILACISNPLACCVAFVLQTQSNLIISTLAFSGTVFSSYIIALAALSPEPFFVDQRAGEIIMIAGWVLTTLSLSYAKVSLALIFRTEGKKALLWCGAATQIGSAVGAITIFVTINVGKVFTSAPLCS